MLVIGRGAKQADFQECWPAWSAIETAGELQNAFPAVGQRGCNMVDQLAENLLDRFSPLSREFEHLLFDKLRRRAMRNDGFLRCSGELINAEEQLLSEAGSEAFAGEGQELIELCDAELGQKVEGFWGEAEGIRG